MEESSEVIVTFTSLVLRNKALISSTASFVLAATKAKTGPVLRLGSVGPFRLPPQPTIVMAVQDAIQMAASFCIDRNL